MEEKSKEDVVAAIGITQVYYQHDLQNALGLPSGGRGACTTGAIRRWLWVGSEAIAIDGSYSYPTK